MTAAAQVREVLAQVHDPEIPVITIEDLGILRDVSVEDVLTEASLTVPETTWRPTGGRRGQHTPCFGYLLAELQHVHRSHPGATW